MDIRQPQTQQAPTRCGVRDALLSGGMSRRETARTAISQPRQATDDHTHTALTAAASATGQTPLVARRSPLTRFPESNPTQAAACDSAMGQIWSVRQRPSTVHTLYRHTLHSIFQFASFRDLQALLFVSREWSAAAYSLPPIRGSVELQPIPAPLGCGVSLFSDTILYYNLLHLAHSKLARHVSSVRGAAVGSLPSLRLVQDLPGLVECDCKPLFQRDGSRIFAALAQLTGLRVLRISLGSAPAPDSAAAAAFINGCIEAIGSGMRGLEELEANLRMDQRVCWQPLATLTRLRRMHVWSADDPVARVPTQEQADEVRDMHSMLQFNHSWSDCNGMLQLILRQPTPPLRWTHATIESGGASDLLPLLRPLSSLTRLTVSLTGPDLDFLWSLPLITDLHLSAPHAAVVPLTDLARIAAAFPCPQLTALELNSLPLTASQVDSVLRSLPRLSKLKFNSLGQLRHLRCLATEPLASSLVELSLFNCRNLPTSELVHLRALRSLRVLSVQQLREWLSDWQCAQLRARVPVIGDLL